MPDRRPKIFLSYSRHDFHVAEMASVVLKTAYDFDVWIDFSALRPGADWEATIEKAIDSSDALLLVASKESVQSDYVRDEWRRALAMNIPVPVLLVGTTSIPSNLEASRIYDGRGQLADCLREFSRDIQASGFSTGSESATSRAADLPLRYSLAFLSMLSAILTQGILLILESAVALKIAAADPPDLYTNTVSVLGSVEVGYAYTRLPVIIAALQGFTLAAIFDTMAYSLWQRRFKPDRFLAVQLWAGLVGTYLPGYAISYNNAVQHSRALLIIASVVIISVMGLALSCSCEVLFGTSLVRYSEVTDTLPYLRRLAAHKKWKPSPPGRVVEMSGLEGGGHPSFCILASRKDKRVSDLIRRACLDLGLEESPNSQRQIVIVSNATDITDLERDTRQHSREKRIYVLASTATIPADSRLLRRSQWVDLRRQDPSATRYLCEGLTESNGPPATTIQIPIHPRRFRCPLDAYLSIGLLAFVGAAFICFSAVGAVTWTRSVSGGSQPLLGLSVLLSFLLGVLYVYHSYKVMERRWSSTYLRCLSMTTLVPLICLWAVVAAYFKASTGSGAALFGATVMIGIIATSCDGGDWTPASVVKKRQGRALMSYVAEFGHFLGIATMITPIALVAALGPHDSAHSASATNEAVPGATLSPRPTGVVIEVTVGQRPTGLNIHDVGLTAARSDPATSAVHVTDVSCPDPQVRADGETLRCRIVTVEDTDPGYVVVHVIDSSANRAAYYLELGYPTCADVPDWARSAGVQCHN